MDWEERRTLIRAELVRVLTLAREYKAEPLLPACWDMSNHTNTE